MPAQPHSITLTPEQVEDLDAKFSELRHKVNNHLSLIVAATEVIRVKPEMAARFVESLSDPPPKIAQEIKVFAAELERVLQITPS